MGCSKNLVVTEEIIGLFKKHNYEIVGDPADAEIILINTCGFIESAKDEGIQTILEMADYSKVLLEENELYYRSNCYIETYSFD